MMKQMIRWVRFAVVLAGMAAIAVPARAAQGPDSVVVVNPVTINPNQNLNVTVTNAATPVPVTVTNPANGLTAADIAKALGVGTPYQQFLGCPLHAGGCFTLQTAIPADQRLVVEYIGGSCDITNGGLTEIEAILTFDGQANVYELPVNDHVGAFNAQEQANVIGFGQVVRLYADAGSSFLLQTRASDPTAAMVGCSIELTGQLVPSP